MDEDEEMWFNDDEFDNDAANGSNGNGGDNEEDEEAAAPVPTSSAAAAVVGAPDNQARDFTSVFESRKLWAWGMRDKLSKATKSVPGTNPGEMFLFLSSDLF